MPFADGSTNTSKLTEEIAATSATSFALTWFVNKYVLGRNRLNRAALDGPVACGLVSAASVAVGEFLSYSVNQMKSSVFQSISGGTMAASFTAGSQMVIDKYTKIGDQTAHPLQSAAIGGVNSVVSRYLTDKFVLPALSTSYTELPQ